MTCPKGHDVILASNDIAEFIPSDDELVEGFGLSLINLFATVFIEWCPVCEKLVSIWVDTPEQEMQTQAAPAATAVVEAWDKAAYAFAAIACPWCNLNVEVTGNMGLTEFTHYYDGKNILTHDEPCRAAWIWKRLAKEFENLSHADLARYGCTGGSGNGI